MIHHFKYFVSKELLRNNRLSQGTVLNDIRYVFILMKPFKEGEKTQVQM